MNQLGHFFSFVKGRRGGGAYFYKYYNNAVKMKLSSSIKRAVALRIIESQFFFRG